jgi:5-methylcytosine-specific restriction endonuclease McrA
MARINVTGRSVEEWRGATPDSKIPPHVRLRVFERFDGICQITRRKIRAGDAWAIDHIVPLADGGSHCETNLVPVLEIAHRQKTGQENTERAKVRAVKSKHFNIRSEKAPMPGSRKSKWKRTMDGRTVER